MNTRWLGTIFIVGTLVLMLNGFRPYNPGDTLGIIANLAWGIGGFCGIAGLIRLNALGSNTVARALGFLPMFGFAFFVLSEALHLGDFITPGTPIYFGLASIAWLAMLAGMLVVGILTIAAKTWRGWRRFVPLLAIVLYPIGYGIGSAIGSDAIGGVLASAFWVLLGYVIATAGPAPVLQPSVTA
ncbi:MAG TPA: hypothetical protein VJL59_09285 [Anaerolineales bacterium]|nr:hypothetical protein [Anaerolineales bacterium]